MDKPQFDWVDIWYEIGMENPFISQACDPEFTKKSFVECQSFEEMYENILKYDCLGQAFYKDDICLIQQVNGGDEWLVIKAWIAFESFSVRAMGKELFLYHMEQIEKATLEQCAKLEY